MAWTTISRSVLLASLAMTATVSAQPLQRDARIRVPAGDRRFTAIGEVYNMLPDGGGGTGALVDSCHVLTASHLMLPDAPLVGSRVYFAGVDATGVQRGSWGKVVVAGRERAASRRTYPYAELAGDWMLVRLDQCLGETLGSLALDPRPMSSFAKVLGAGHPAGSDWTIDTVVDPTCGAWPLDDFIATDCVSLHGNSGSPLLRRDPTDPSRMRIVAMQVASGTKCNFAAPIPAIAARIAPYLAGRDSPKSDHSPPDPA